MKTLASAAILSALLAGHVLGAEPAPGRPPAPLPSSAGKEGKEGAAKDDAKRDGAGEAAKKPAPKPATDPKDAPCEPVKPCPIE